jgi:hypothetical protein
MPVSCFVYLSTLKMEATCFSENSVDFQQTTQRYIAARNIIEVGSKANASELYPEVSCSNLLQDIGRSDWGFLQILNANAEKLLETKPPPLSSTIFAIQYSLNLVPFDAL